MNREQVSRRDTGRGSEFRNDEDRWFDEGGNNDEVQGSGYGQQRGNRREGGFRQNRPAENPGYGQSYEQHNQGGPSGYGQFGPSGYAGPGPGQSGFGNYGTSGYGQGGYGSAPGNYAPSGQTGYGQRGYGPGSGQSFGQSGQSAYGQSAFGGGQMGFATPGRFAQAEVSTFVPGSLAWWQGGPELWSRYRQQTRFFGRGPKGYKRSDERICEAVNDCLCDGTIDASNVTVSCQNGEVTLSGTVDNRQMKFVAECMAENVSGVIDVQNRLRITREISSSGRSDNSGSTMRDDSEEQEKQSGQRASKSTSLAGVRT